MTDVRTAGIKDLVGTGTYDYIAESAIKYLFGELAKRDDRIETLLHQLSEANEGNAKRGAAIAAVRELPQDNQPLPENAPFSQGFLTGWNAALDATFRTIDDALGGES